MYRRPNNAVLRSGDDLAPSVQYPEIVMKCHPGCCQSCMCCAMRNAQPCMQPILETIS
jgi:hypothetical protein